MHHGGKEEKKEKKEENKGRCDPLASRLSAGFCFSKHDRLFLYLFHVRHDWYIIQKVILNFIVDTHQLLMRNDHWYFWRDSVWGKDRPAHEWPPPYQSLPRHQPIEMQPG